MGVTTALTRSQPGTRSPAGRWLPRLAWATLVANVVIVVTGGVVRLTGSGLGCPTWPRCTDDSFTPHGAMGVHAAIEFGNRMVTLLIAAVAVATFLAALRAGRPALTRLALVLGLGVPAQAVLGGITVLTGLNPWTVSLHLLLSLAMICAAVVLVVRVGEPDGPPRPVLPPGVRSLVWAVFAAGWLVLYLGTVVTGSGPHAGDAEAPRNGLDPRAVAQLHTDAVFLLLGLSLAAVLVLRSLPAPPQARTASVVLLGVLLAQGTIGFVQYLTGLPVVLVGLHLLGAALTAAAMTWLLVTTREPARAHS